MPVKNVKTLLFLSYSNSKSSFSILFQCAEHWAQQGSRVLFISKSPINYLPVSLGTVGSSPNPDAYKLIQFMYLTSCQELLQQLYSIHLRRNPVSVIIVKDLGNYFKPDSGIDNHEDQTSLICASLLYAASICSKVTLETTFLISDYVSQDMTIDKNVVKSFFHNVWEIESNEEVDVEGVLKLSKLSPLENNEIVGFLFNRTLDELSFSQVIRRLIS